jgi:beta-phosphoglucomutase-like phosphatase (HAD superfamily)
MPEAIIKKIYLDMDGVIADFDRRYKSRYKMLPREAEEHKEFDKFFTQFIKDGEFATLDLMPDAMDLINFLRSLKVPTEILSSSASEKRDPDIRPQKLEWLKKNNIEFPAIIVPGKRHKKEYSNKNTLLIDDTSVNIDQWRREGGIGILHTDAFTTINILKMYV